MRLIDKCSPELQFVIFASLSEITEEHDARITRLVDQDLDIALVEKEADVHHLYPTLIYNLKRLGLTKKMDFSNLTKISQEYAMESMKLMRAFSTVMGTLQKAEIPAVLMKGPILAQLMYGNVSRRPSRDLDILVRKEDFRKAVELIEGAGFQNIEGIDTPKRRDFYFSHLQKHHIELADDEVLVELHWRSDEVTKLTLEQMTSEGKTMKLGGMDMSLPNDMENLYFLISHGSRHAYCRLRWLIDIYELLYVRKMVEPEVLMKYFADRKVGHLFLMTIHFMEELDLIPVQPVNRWEGYNQKDNELAEELLGKAWEEYFVEHAASERTNEEFEITYEELLSRKGIHMVHSLAERFEPTPLEFQLINLPDFLFYLYYPLRVILWLWRKTPFYQKEEGRRTKSITQLFRLVKSRT